MYRTAPKQLIRHSGKIDPLIIFVLHLCYHHPFQWYCRGFSKSLFRWWTSLPIPTIFDPCRSKGPHLTEDINIDHDYDFLKQNQITVRSIGLAPFFYLYWWTFCIETLFPPYSNWNFLLLLPSSTTPRASAPRGEWKYIGRYVNNSSISIRIDN